MSQNIRTVSLLGSTQSQPFQSLLARFNLSAAATGVNTNTFTIAALMNGDLTSRLVRLVRVVVRFHPYNQATTSGAHYSTQLQAVDPISSGTSIIPMSMDTPLSSTNVVVLQGTSPFVTSWQPANSTGVVLNIPVWAQAALAAGLFADITTYWLIAQDNLT
jgi:hypothetical protein